MGSMWEPGARSGVGERARVAMMGALGGGGDEDGGGVEGGVVEVDFFDEADVRRLAGSGARVILVGESLMRHAELEAKVRELMAR